MGSLLGSLRSLRVALRRQSPALPGPAVELLWSGGATANLRGSWPWIKFPEGWERDGGAPLKLISLGPGSSKQGPPRAFPKRGHRTVPLPRNRTHRSQLERVQSYWGWAGFPPESPFKWLTQGSWVHVGVSFLSLPLPSQQCCQHRSIRAGFWGTKAGDLGDSPSPLRAALNEDSFL